MYEDLDVVVGFLNTIDPDADTDELVDTATAQRWLSKRGLLPATETIDGEALATARALRAALRDLAMAHHDGRADGEAAERFTALAAGLPLRAAADEHGSVGVRAAGHGGSAALASIVAAIARASETGVWPRVKICPAETCLWAFVDESRNQSRRWCAMGVCGNRQKTRAYRERQRGH